jgi:hypothetical protein
MVIHFEVVYCRNVAIFVKTSWEMKIIAKIFAKTKIFTKQNFTKFLENLLIFASFSLFTKMEKTVFVSTQLTLGVALPVITKCKI